MGKVVGGYHEFMFWSPILDADMCRVTLFDERGGEYYMLVDHESGKHYRRRREDALRAITAAIEIGLEPGEVKVNDG